MNLCILVKDGILTKTVEGCKLLESLHSCAGRLHHSFFTKTSMIRLMYPFQCIMLTPK